MEIENKSGYCCKPDIDCGKLLDAKTLSMCDGVDIDPEGIEGPLVAKIPVVLAEKDIQIDIEADIKLKEKYYEIKRIYKDVYLTQCKLVPVEINDEPVGKLFIEGYVRENIEYASAECVKDGVVSGDIKHTTVKVPFSCVTQIDYSANLQIGSKNEENQYDFTCQCPCDQCKCDDIKLGKLDCESYMQSTTDFIDKPYCDLIGSRIYEIDIQQKACRDEYGAKVYDKLKEKLVVYVTVKVLQNQQVNID